MIRPICLTAGLPADTIVAVPEQSVPQQESYSPIDPRDWPARFREMSEFVGLSEEDLDLIRASGPLVQAKLQSFVDHIYDHFLEYPESRKFFVHDNGSPDRKRIDDNKLTMIRWMMNNCLAHINDGFSRYVAAIGTMHYSVAVHRPPLPPVPYKYLIGVISMYQTKLAALFDAEMDNEELAARTSLAWNKLLMVELDLILAAYVTEPSA